MIEFLEAWEKERVETEFREQIRLTAQHNICLPLAKFVRHLNNVNLSNSSFFSVQISATIMSKYSLVPVFSVIRALALVSRSIIERKLTFFVIFVLVRRTPLLPYSSLRK